MIWLICILWLGSAIPYWESIFHVYESLSSWIDDCSPIRETTPCFDHEFRRSVTKLQTLSNEFRTRAPTLVWPHCDANREPNWYSPTSPNSTCGSPQFFLHHEATVSCLWLNWPLSSPRNEWKSRMLIANAEIIHKDQCDPNIFIIFT